MASSASSLSTLSAKARPFVPPQSKPSPSSQSILSAKAPPFTKPNNPKSQIDPLTGESDCPIYDLLGFVDGFSSSSYNGDAGLEPSSDFDGFHDLSVGPWNAPFDQQVGQLDLDESCVTSLWTLPSLDPQGTQPKVKITPTHKVSWALTSSSTSESCNASSSNSCYNDSKAQIYISSANPVACHPGTSAHVYASSVHETSSTANSVSKTINRVCVMPEVSNTSQEIKHEEGFDRIGAACNTTGMSTAAGNPSTMKKGAASSNTASNVSLAKPIKLRNIPTSKMSTKQDDSLHNSSETLDQLDADVDSPCWKGIPACQWSPFSIDEAVTTDLAAVNSVTVTDVVKDQPHIPTTAGYGKTTYYLEKDENFMSGTKKASAFNSERSFDVASSSQHEKCEYLFTVGSETNYKRTQHLDTCEGQITNMTKDQGKKSGAHGKEKLLLDQKLQLDQGATNHPREADDLAISNSSLEYAAQNSSSNGHSNAVITNPTSISIESNGPDVLFGKAASFTGRYKQIIDETLQCLRKRLLSRAYRDNGELNGLLHEILLLVNDYPNAHVLKNKKGIANGCYDDSGVEAATLQSRVLKGQGHVVIPQGNKDGAGDARGIANGSHDVFVAEAAQCQSPIVKGQGNAVIHQCNMDDKWEGKSDTTLIQSTNFKTYQDTDVQGKMQPIGCHATYLQAIAGGNFCDYVLEFTQSQDFERILKKNVCEREDNVRTLLHRNLWIEAEAKLLSMKYELKLARAEIELLKHGHFAQGRLQEVNGFASPNHWLDSQSSKPLIDSRENNQNFDQDMTRPGVLRIKN